MIRLVGATALLAACIMAGFMRFRGKKAALEDMVSFCRLLQLLRAELNSCASPLPDALRCAAINCTGSAERLAWQLIENMDRLGEESFGELWLQACRDWLINLPTELRQSAEGLGSVLGRYETGEQLRAIDRLVLMLEERQRGAALALHGERRLSLGLSAVFGLLLVILLI